jgi:hypothetical protein
MKQPKVDVDQGGAKAAQRVRAGTGRDAACDKTAATAAEWIEGN